MVMQEHPTPLIKGGIQSGRKRKTWTREKNREKYVLKQILIDGSDKSLEDLI